MKHTAERWFTFASGRDKTGMKRQTLKTEPVDND